MTGSVPFLFLAITWQRLPPSSVFPRKTQNHLSGWLGLWFVTVHRGLAQGHLAGKARSVHNQTKLKMAGVQLPFSWYKVAFLVHLMYKYTTTGTTVYIHLAMVISVATLLCKLACFHIKSPHFLFFLRWTLHSKTKLLVARKLEDLSFKHSAIKYVIFQEQWQKY